MVERSKCRIVRYATADFTETDLDDNEDEDGQQEEDEQDDDAGDDEDGHEDAPLLPIFSAAHLGEHE